MDNFGPALSLNNFPSNMAERIEIYKGVVPISLGADALGGAVNIITRSNSNYLDASYSVGSFNTHQLGLKYAIVDLEKQEITEVKNSPVYDGAEDPFLEGDKVYIPAKVGSSLNIYEVDIPTATAKKGLEVDATYVLAIGKLTK